jgi:hypothetical protein
LSWQLKALQFKFNAQCDLLATGGDWRPPLDADALKQFVFLEDERQTDERIFKPTFFFSNPEPRTHVLKFSSTFSNPSFQTHDGFENVSFLPNRVFRILLRTFNNERHYQHQHQNQHQ